MPPSHRQYSTAESSNGLSSMRPRRSYIWYSSGVCRPLQIPLADSEELTTAFLFKGTIFAPDESSRSWTFCSIWVNSKPLSPTTLSRPFTESGGGEGRIRQTVCEREKPVTHNRSHEQRVLSKVFVSRRPRHVGFDAQDPRHCCICICADWQRKAKRHSIRRQVS